MLSTYHYLRRAPVCYLLTLPEEGSCMLSTYHYLMRAPVCYLLIIT